MVPTYLTLWSNITHDFNMEACDTGYLLVRYNITNNFNIETSDIWLSMGEEKYWKSEIIKINFPDWFLLL